MAKFKAEIHASERFETFWDQVDNHTWEPHTLAAIECLLSQDDIFIDVGAWIGPTALIGAFKAKKVICYEPDPVALEELRQNLSLNNMKHVEVRDYALFDHNGEMGLSSGWDGDLGQSASTLMSRKYNYVVQVKDIRQEILLSDFRDCSLLKMDVEGAEYTLIPLLSSYLGSSRHTLLLSVHSQKIAMGKSKWWMKPSYIYMRLKLFKVIQNYPKLYIEMHGAHEDHFIPMGFKEKVK